MTAKTKARARGGRGIKSSADHAGQEWQDQAVAAARLAVRMIARIDPRTAFTIEQIRLFCEPRIDAPSELRAWGAVTRRLKSEGVIRPTGDYAKAASSNLSPKPLYRRA